MKRKMKDKLVDNIDKIAVGAGVLGAAGLGLVMWRLALLDTKHISWKDMKKLCKPKSDLITISDVKAKDALVIAKDIFEQFIDPVLDPEEMINIMIEVPIK